MQRIGQSPRDPDFVQDPYRFYARARLRAPVLIWTDYEMPALFSHAAVTAALKHPDLARVPRGGLPPWPPHLARFAALEAHSLLNLEGPGHARLRGLVLRAFTGARVRQLAPQIAALCYGLIDRFPDRPFDLMAAYCERVPVIVIARMLGVDPAAETRLLDWSHAMVAMYQARADAAVEARAEQAAAAFTDWLRAALDQKRKCPDDGLLSALAAAGDDDRLSEDEIIATAVLLLNAGHEATVNALGLATVRLLSTGAPQHWTAPERIDAAVEECLRLDPPLHLFTRHVLAPVEIAGTRLDAGQQIACLLGAANRDPDAYAEPDQFRPGRPGPVLTSFGAGVHFCLGAPLARLEMRIALQVLFQRCPELRLAARPALADSYHFHGYPSLPVSV